MRVELDVYSGRPNPRWELTDQQAAELLTRLEAAQPVPGDSASFDGQSTPSSDWDGRYKRLTLLAREPSNVGHG